MKIIIESIDNGWLITYPNGCGNTDQEVRMAFNYPDMDMDDHKECEALRDVLWEVISFFKPYSKHSKYNVVAHVEKEGEIIDN